MSTRYRWPTLLTGDHDLSGFECRSVEQTDWLRRYARVSAAVGTTRVYVVTPADSPSVVAYYAWCMAHLDIDAAPPRLRKGAGRYPQPVALLARLGVDVQHEGLGLGAGLLQDVFTRIARLSSDIGCRALLVHAESGAARDFYLHLVPEFEQSPTDDLHLVLLMKDILLTLRKPRGGPRKAVPQAGLIAAAGFAQDSDGRMTDAKRLPREDRASLEAGQESRPPADA